MIPRASYLAAVAVAASLAFAGGCQKDQGQKLLITGAAAVTPDTQCIARPGTGQVIRYHGLLDLAMTNQYWAFPTFRNEMPTIAELTGEGPQNLTFETNVLSIVGAEVRLDLGAFDNGADIAIEYVDYGFTWPTAVSVDPDGEGAVAVQVVPPDLGNFMQGLMADWIRANFVYPSAWVTAYITLVAMTQDRWTVRSNEFAFPIQVCWKCTVFCCSGGMNPKPTGNEELTCLPGQDDPICDTLCPLVSLHYQSDPTVCSVCPPL